MYSFFAYLNRMKYIKRWSLMKSMQEENILEHSAQVAQIAHAIAIIRKEIYKQEVDVDKCAASALYHDCSEVITGDLPTPVKYFNKSIINAYEDIEKHANERLLEKLPNELSSTLESYLNLDKNSIEFQIVKAADKISAYIKCIEECKFGNHEFTKALKANEVAVKDLAKLMPEVKYFLDYFIESYKLTLDDLD